MQTQQAWKTAWELIARAADDAGWMLFAEMALLLAVNSEGSERDLSTAPAKAPKAAEPVTSGWQSCRRKRDPWRD